MDKTEILKFHSLKEKLDEIDNQVLKEVYSGFYDSRLRIKLGMWEKGKAIAEFRGVNSASFPLMEKETGRQRETLKKWHDLYRKHPDRERYLEVAKEESEEWTQKTIQKLIEEKEASKALVSKFTGDQENFTPEEIVKSVKEVFGGEIDLDPASCDFAQNLIKAKTYFTEEDDGLNKRWTGNVFLNPPYQMPHIRQFTDKLIDEIPNIKSAILLTNNNTDTSWFHKSAKNASVICFTKGRINFYKTDKDKTYPTNGQSFFYFGKNEKEFNRVFSNIGLLVRCVE